MFLQIGRKLRPFGILHANQVLDAKGIVHLSAEALCDDPSTNPFTCGVNRRTGTGRSAPYDKHVVRLFAFKCRRVRRAQFPQNILDRHPAVTEQLPVQEYGWHRHDLFALDFILESRAVDHRMGNAWIQNAKQVQCLNDVRAVMAGQADIGFKTIFASNPLDLINNMLFNLGRSSADLQQSQYQGSKLMAQWDTGKGDAGLFPNAIHAEAWGSG
ncbi:hypothetical protein D3C81_699170 [compost metagenome]